MLTLEGVGVDLDARPVLDGVDLRVAPGETVAILGPSGCGKTTMLRAIAGLEPISRGRVTWDGVDLREIEPHRRRFGFVFQDYALFPHRDVLSNVEFGLEMQGVARSQRRARAADALVRVGLEGFEHRSVSRLSGGEQQRVALARVLVVGPRLLMFDEPLGALDRDLRRRLLRELRATLAEMALPALYVTHDQEEAFAIGDRVAVMRDGKLVQVGAPADLYAAPATPWIADFLGFGPRVALAAGECRPVTPWGAVPLDVAEDAATLVLRPGDVVVAAPDEGVAGRVVDVRFTGEHWELTVAVPGAPTVDVRAETPHPVGETLHVALATRRLLTFPA